MDIGLEIKILRERAKMSSKDLAEKIGLSGSQMSRLEKGQRRVDTEILNKIAGALGVSPTYFFERESSGEVSPVEVGELSDSDLQVQKVNLDIGKMIRSERRKRHFTAEELGNKIGRNKPYIHAIEEGKIDQLNPETLQKICRVLKMDSSEFFSTQQKIILHLKKQLLRVSQAYSESTRGTVEFSSQGETVSREAIPILGSIAEGYPTEFSAEGLPVGDVEEYVFVPGIKDESAFALFVVGESMIQRESPSFQEGDIVIFSPQAEVRGGDYIFVRPAGDSPSFRQVFFDSGAKIRLQPINRYYPPMICTKAGILGWWKMMAHVQRG